LTKAIELFKPGRHITMSGEVITFSDSDLRATAEAYDPAVYEAPLVIGHPKLDDPAYGWAKSLAFADSVLRAEPAQVEPAFEKLVNAGRFKRISPSFFKPHAASNPKPGVYYLRHIGFLGAKAPSVAGLKPVQFSDDAEGVIEFADGADFNVLMRLFRSLRELVISKFGAEEADRAVPEWMIESVRAQKSLSYAEPSTTAIDKEHTMTSEEIAAEKAKLKKQEEDLAKRNADFAAREEKIKTSEAQARRNGVVSFVEGLVKEGRLLPRDQAPLVEFMAGLDEETVIEFADGSDKKKEPGGKWLRGFLSRLPQQVDYHERARAEGDDRASAAVSFAAPSGYAVDPKRLDLHNKARAYQHAHPNTTYDAAIAAVSN
jgi:hypothetical protein